MVRFLSCGAPHIIDRSHSRGVATPAGTSPVALLHSAQEDEMKKTAIKTEIKTHKLHLDRQVLRSLQTQEISKVVGGTLPSAPTGISGPPRLCCA